MNLQTNFEIGSNTSQNFLFYPLLKSSHISYKKVKMLQMKGQTEHPKNMLRKQ